MVQDDNAADGRPEGGIRLTTGFGDTAPALASTHGVPGQRILVIGAFGGRGGATRHVVDPHELSGLPGRLGVSVEVAVPNLLGGSPPMLGARIAFDALRDMAPKRVAERFQPLADAMRVADGTLPDDGRFPLLAQARLGSPGSGSSAPSAAPPSPAAGDGDLDRLLGMIDTPGSAADDGSAARRAVSAFIASTSSSPRPAAAGSGTAGLIAAQRKALLQDPGLREVLESWQGLRLLAQAIGKDGSVRVELVDTGDRDPAGMLAGEIADEELRSGEPVPALVVVASRLRADASGLELARAIARAAERLQAPAVVSLAADFGNGLDVASAQALDEPGLILERPGFEVWSALRDEDAGRWLCAAWNDVLVRAADEEAPAMWLAPAWVVAAQVLRSIDATGWPSEIVGRSAAVSGFDVHEVDAAGRRAACATAGLFTANACRSLADSGILALAGVPDRDEVATLVAPTVHRPGRFPDDPHGQAARLLSSLPYQLAAARLAVLASHARSQLMGDTPAELAAAMESWLGGVLVATGPGAAIGVRVEPDADDPSRNWLVIDARTGTSVLGGESFGFDLPV